MSVLDGARKEADVTGGYAKFCMWIDGNLHVAYLPESVVDEIIRLRDGEAALLARCAELERRLDVAKKVAWAEKHGGGPLA